MYISRLRLSRRIHCSCRVNYTFVTLSIDITEHYVLGTQYSHDVRHIMTLRHSSHHMHMVVRGRPYFASIRLWRTVRYDWHPKLPLGCFDGVIGKTARNANSLAIVFKVAYKGLHRVVFSFTVKFVFFKLIDKIKKRHKVCLLSREFVVCDLKLVRLPKIWKTMLILSYISRTRIKNRS